MTVYIEYALLENFLIDGMLLYLAFRAAKAPFKWKKLCFSAFFGAAFALLFPLLSLPFWGAYCLKFAVGFLLCLLAFPPIKNKNDVGRYALTCALFFLLSFAFAGVIFAIFGSFSLSGNGYQVEQTPVVFVLCSALAFLILIINLVRKIYKKQERNKARTQRAFAPFDNHFPKGKNCQKSQRLPLQTQTTIKRKGRK